MAQIPKIGLGHRRLIALRTFMETIAYSVDNVSVTLARVSISPDDLAGVELKGQLPA
jgi:hypothetical protein